MVVRRTCSFCAGEIEPGTGQLFVKRDGSLFSFCSSSCRKQQLGLGRVGHRLRWTHAHELKRQAEQRRQPAATGTPAKPAPSTVEGKPKESASPPSESAPRKKPAKPQSTEAGPKPTAEDAKESAKKPRAKKAPATPTKA